MSKILLSRPDNAPNFCFEVFPATVRGTVRKRWPDGRPCKESLFIQTDWDYPGLARNFGWDISAVKPDKEPDYYTPDWRTLPVTPDGGEGQVCPEEAAEFERYERQCKCQHDGTDGTIDCRECGLTASDFIGAAYDYLCENDGAVADDPGYFDV